MKKEIEYLEYDILNQFINITALTFFRHGGVSKSSFETLNLSNKVGDNPDAVNVNIELIKKLLNLENLVFLNQAHGNKIIEITNDNKNVCFEADGAITKEKQIGLCISHADCQAAVFYDCKQQVIAAAHAGWRGLLNENIYKKMIDKLTNDFQCDVNNIYVCISPSLSAEKAVFDNYKEEIDEKYWQYQVKPKCFDLKKIACLQLKECGIQESKIEISDICTFLNYKDCFSFRRDRITGRHATVIGLK